MYGWHIREQRWVSIERGAQRKVATRYSNRLFWDSIAAGIKAGIREKMYGNTE